MSRLALGLIGGGILAATKGFAQAVVRPQAIQGVESVVMLNTPGASAPSRIGDSDGLYDRSPAPDAPLELKYDMDLGVVREIGTDHGRASEGLQENGLSVTLKLSGSLGGSGSDGPTPTALGRSVVALNDERRRGRESDSQSAGFLPAFTPEAFGSLSAVAGTVRLGVLSEEAPLEVAQNALPVRPGDREETTSAPETPVPLESVVPGPSPGRSKTPAPGGAPEDRLPDLSSVGYQLAPVRWSGTTGSTVVLSQATGVQSLSTTQSLDLRLASFIYQPWFARVGGNFGVSSNESSTNSGGAGGTGGSSSNKVNATSFNYGADVSLFPVSRFPFQANVNHSSNVATAQDQSSVSSSTRFGMRQNYRPEIGNESYSANYDRSMVTTSTGNSLVNTAGATFATSMDDHSLTSSLRYSGNSGEVGGQSMRTFGASAAHTWHLDDDFRISSSANFSNSQSKMISNSLSGGTLLVNSSNLAQANTSVVWVPDPDLPLTITGGGSVFGVATDTGVDKSQQFSVTGQGNANYRFSPNLGATGGVSLGLSQNQTSGGPAISSLNSSQNVAVSYSGNPQKIFDFSYGWNTGGSFSNNLSSGSGNQGGSRSFHTLGANASHSVSRPFPLAPLLSINTYASQGIGVSTSNTAASTSTSGSSVSTTLNHSIGASANSAYSESLTGALSVSGSDNLSTGQNQSHFRTFSLNGTGQWKISRRSGMTASANAAWTQSVTSASSISGTTLTTSKANTAAQWSGGGSISYNHSNPFGIQNLQYGATFSVTTSQTNLRVAASDPDALSWVVSNAFLQRVDYILGRVRFQGTASVATIDRKTSTSVFFSMQRAFGDF